MQEKLDFSEAQNTSSDICWPGAAPVARDQNHCVLGIPTQRTHLLTVQTMTDLLVVSRE